MWALVKGLAGGAMGFLSPTVIIAGLLVASHTAVWVKATWVANEHCQTAELKAEIARLKLEAKTQAEADEQESIDTAVLLSDQERREREDAALIEELRNRPNKCLLGPDAGRV